MMHNILAFFILPLRFNKQSIVTLCCCHGYRYYEGFLIIINFWFISSITYVLCVYLCIGAITPSSELFIILSVSLTYKNVLFKEQINKNYDHVYISYIIYANDLLNIVDILCTCDQTNCVHEIKVVSIISPLLWS